MSEYFPLLLIGKRYKSESKLYGMVCDHYTHFDDDFKTICEEWGIYEALEHEQDGAITAFLDDDGVGAIIGIAICTTDLDDIHDNIEQAKSSWNELFGGVEGKLIHMVGSY